MLQMQKNRIQTYLTDNEVVDAQISIKSYFALTGIFCWFWASGPYIFQKEHKICN